MVKPPPSPPSSPRRLMLPQLLRIGWIGLIIAGSTIWLFTTPQNVSGSLQNVDWKNFTYSGLCEPNTHPPVQFHVKQGIAHNGIIQLQIFTPSFGDITGDGQPEAIIPFQCSAVEYGGIAALVYTGTSTHPLLLGILPPPNDTTSQIEIASIDSIRIVNKEITLTGYAFASPSTPYCCPDLPIRATYAWNGSHFITLSSETENYKV